MCAWLPQRARPLRLVAGTAEGLALLLVVGCTQTMHAFPEEYVGVGVELTVRDGVPQVVQVVPGSPADMAGLAPGMELRTVAGEDVRGRPLADVVKLLRGKPETRVSVEAAQGGRTFRVSLLRRSLTRAGADGGGYLTGSR